MAKSLTVVVKLPVSDIKDMIKYANFKIANRTKFNEIIASPKFQKSIANELINTFRIMNEKDDDGILDEIVINLFGDAVADAFYPDYDE